MKDDKSRKTEKQERKNTKRTELKKEKRKRKIKRKRKEIREEVKSWQRRKTELRKGRKDEKKDRSKAEGRKKGRREWERETQRMVTGITSLSSSDVSLPAASRSFLLKGVSASRGSRFYLCSTICIFTLFVFYDFDVAAKLHTTLKAKAEI